MPKLRKPAEPSQEQLERLTANDDVLYLRAATYRALGYTFEQISTLTGVPIKRIYLWCRQSKFMDLVEECKKPDNSYDEIVRKARQLISCCIERLQDALVTSNDVQKITVSLATLVDKLVLLNEQRRIEELRKNPESDLRKFSTEDLISEYEKSEKTSQD